MAVLGLVLTGLGLKRAEVSIKLLETAAELLFEGVGRRVLDEVQARLRAYVGKVPPNHDLEYAIRIAELTTSLVLLEFYRREDEEERFDQRAARPPRFIAAARGWLHHQLDLAAKLQVITNNTVISELEHKLDFLLATDDRSTLLSELNVTETEVLNELKAGAAGLGGGEPPQDFTTLFFGGTNGTPGWTVIFQALMREAMKNNPMARVAFVTTRLASLRSELGQLEPKLDVVQRDTMALRQGQATVLAGLAALDAKVDALTVSVREGDIAAPVLPSVSALPESAISKSRPFHGLPSQLQTFTGREIELEALNATLNGSEKPTAIIQSGVGITAVRGLGGIGKTSLAIEYAYRFRSLYGGVWWCQAETRARLLEDLTALGIELGVSSADESNLEHVPRLALDALAKGQTPWLLVYDNVPDPEAIAGLLPSAGARVLITSRFADWMSCAEEVRLDVFLPESAAEFLQKRSGHVDLAGANLLAERLGYLPLALDHAAAYCRRTQMRFGDYTSKAEALMSHRPRGVDYPLSVAVTFDLAIQEAVRHCPDADAVMDFLAFGAPERMPLSLLEGSVETESRLNEALAALSELSLLRFDPLTDGTPAVTMHRLVLVVGRARAAQKGRASEVVAQLLTRLAAVYPKDGYSDPACWSICERLTPHLLDWQSAELPDTAAGAGWAELLNRAGNYFHGNGNYSTAELMLRQAVDLGTRYLGRADPRVGAWLNDFALLLSETGRRADAEPLLREAITISERAQGRVHQDVATALSNLADLLNETGRHAEAETLFREALAISQQVFGCSHPEVATDLVNLAAVLRINGQFNEAERLLKKAIAIDELRYGPEHPSVQLDWCNFADLLIVTDRADEALKYAERALTIHEKVLGFDNRWTKDSAGTTADALDALGRMVEAEAVRARYALTPPENR